MKRFDGRRVSRRREILAFGVFPFFGFEAYGTNGSAT